MANAHYTRDYVWVVHVDLGSISTIPYSKYKSLGITGIYLNAADNRADRFKRQEVLNAGFKCGYFYPARTDWMDGLHVARDVDARLTMFAGNDSGQTPVLLDFEPSDGAVPFWKAFIPEWRALRPGRVTDFTPDPFKASVLPVSDLLDARFDCRVQYYFGDMSPVDGGEARENWEIGLNGVGFPKEAIRGFVDGGRVIKPPIFYQGQIVRKLEPGTCIWNSNLLRESGLA